MSKKRRNFLCLSISALLLSACGIPQTVEEEINNADYTMFLPIHALTMNFHHDLNTLPVALHLESRTDLIIDYQSPMPGQEEITFILDMATKEMADFFRYDLSTYYPGGVDMAIEDGMIHDYGPLLESYAPNYMEKISQYPDYHSLAFTDNGTHALFGVTLVDEELRGQANYGPVINKTYLDQVGLPIPETIADWESVLEAFHNLDIVPFTFGADEGFQHLYDCFASAYGVTIGELLFQENGTVKCSPLEDGYYDFLVMMHKWYENGWIAPNFFDLNHNDTVKNSFEKGEAGASVLPISSLVTAPVLSQSATGIAMEFVAAPYPVLQQGDIIQTREYTPDFYNAPIFIHSQVDDPIELIQWIDFFYSEEGTSLTNWGKEDITYTTNDQGEKELTDYVLQNPDHPVVTVLAQEAFQEMSLVMEWENQSLYFHHDIYESAREQWQKANYQNLFPQTMSYSYDESSILTLILYSIETYVYQSSVNFIMGLQPLSEYDSFVQSLLDIGIEEVIELNQNALDRYFSR